MSRILICTHPITGHVNPALVIVRKLVQRGHDVRFYTGAKFKAKVEAAGAQYIAMNCAYDYDDADLDTAFPERSQFAGLQQVMYDFKQVFIKQMAGEVEDLRKLFKTWMPDLLVSDTAFAGANALFSKGEIPLWAVFNITVLGLASRDIPPYGLGMLPTYSAWGRLKNRVLDFAATNIVFRDVNKYLRGELVKLGLPAQPFAPMFSPMLYLQPTVPSFEYPRTDLPESVHFIGPVLPDLKANFQTPTWWDDVEHAQKPVVLVTQGTIATQADELIEPTIRALANEDVLVVATVDPKTLNIPIPANVRMEKFIPFDKLMPHVDVMVTNGGYGGVTLALAQGVPVICAGNTEDKAEVGNRAEYSGVGINLKTNRPSIAQIQAAVKTVLTNARYKLNADYMKEDFARHDAATEAAVLIEKLIATRQPVVNPSHKQIWSPSYPAISHMPEVMPN
ncbi:MAG: glycosyltransferase [Anaerolineaceae bacterium]|nr:glycosyltransferase [Anaerolineaceae bacterium]